MSDKVDSGFVDFVFGASVTAALFSGSGLLMVLAGWGTETTVATASIYGILIGAALSPFFSKGRSARPQNGALSSITNFIFSRPGALVTLIISVLGGGHRKK